MAGVFGIGFQKLAVLIAIALAAWTVIRIVRKLDAGKDARVAKGRERVRVTQDMKECPVCRVYVAPASALDCGRPRCPYPKAAA